MASSLKNLSVYDETTFPNTKNMKFGVVVSDWNSEITHALFEGCRATLLKHGVLEENVWVTQVPGAFELPMGARMLGKHKVVDAIICLGCVIKGETRHDEYINSAVAEGLMSLSLATGVPHIFGLLTTENWEQAHDRAGGKHGNKGVEAAVTAVRMADLQHGFANAGKSIGFK